MTNEFLCGTFCMLALLLIVVLIGAKHRENFASGSYENAPSVATHTTDKRPEQNLPKTIDDATSKEASDIKSKQDSVAEMRRMIRSELQTQRRFQLPEEDLADAEEDSEMQYRRKMSPANDQAHQFRASRSSNCPDCPNGCQSPDYIKKDSIPCWGCSLPSSTD